MKTKNLILPVIALSFLAVPAFAADYQKCAFNSDGTVSVTGDQLTDSSGRGSTIRTGSFVEPKADMAAACAREEAGYNARPYGRRHYDTSSSLNDR